MRIASAVLSLAIVSLLSGCATNGGFLPVRTKSEARAYKLGAAVTIKADYLRLTRYWDEYCPKATIDITEKFWELNIFEADKTAHLVCANGFIQGMIELEGRPDGTTVMTTYAWGGAASTVESWRDFILTAPFIRR